jgi:hypothetical protein
VAITSGHAVHIWSPDGLLIRGHLSRLHAHVTCDAMRLLFYFCVSSLVVQNKNENIPNVRCNGRVMCIILIINILMRDNVCLPYIAKLINMYVRTYEHTFF